MGFIGRGEGIAAIAVALLGARMSAFGSERAVRPAIVSWGSTAIGRHPGRTPAELGFEALDRALERIGLPAAELQGLFLVPHGYARAQAPLRPSRVAEELGLPTRALVEVECGGASSLLAFKAACQEVATGQLEVAAVIGAQAERRLYEEGMDEGDLDRVYLLASMFGSYVAPYGVLTRRLAATRSRHSATCTSTASPPSRSPSCRCAFAGTPRSTRSPSCASR